MIPLKNLADGTEAIPPAPCKTCFPPILVRRTVSRPYEKRLFSGISYMP